MDIRRGTRAAVLALIGAAAGSSLVFLFENTALSRWLQVPNISAAARDSGIAEAACVAPNTKSAENDVFFISCGGIY